MMMLNPLKEREWVSVNKIAYFYINFRSKDIANFAEFRHYSPKSFAFFSSIKDHCTVLCKNPPFYMLQKGGFIIKKTF